MRNSTIEASSASHTQRQFTLVRRSYSEDADPDARSSEVLASRCTNRGQITDQEHQEDSKRGLSSASTCGPDLHTSRKDETGLRLKTPQRARRLPTTNAKPAITTSTPAPTAAHAQAGNPPADEDAWTFFPGSPDEDDDPVDSFSAVISTP